jgi:endonuclease YncB( thermonuclease family)
MTRTAIVIGLLFGMICSGALAAELTGIPRISDGDTITIASTKIRLEGIDAPETDQLCLDERGAIWTCGIEARERLAARVGGHEITCRLSGTDRYHRSLGTCSLDGADLNAWMVQEGWALAFVHYSQAYAAEESAARTDQRGLWKGAFIAPWDWRHRDRKTIVLGALSVPLTAQAELLAPASSAGAPSLECTIKGNVNRSGERIYHMPGQVAYAHINMAGAGKRWFCTPDEAAAAGWRPAMR